MVDRVVEYGKHEEEERLTGCIQNRRTLRECCSILTSTIFLTVLLAASILFTINLSIRARDSTLPPTGTLYPVHNNKYHVHLHCVGNKTTTLGHPIITVLLEPDNVPVEGRLEYWATFSTVVQRYCYWDRPGIAWSENGPSPMSAGMVVDVLSEALRKAGEDKTPLILVSHGFGGVYSRIFASRHGHAVKGLLLVDTLPESLLGRVANPRKGFMLWLRGVLYPLGIDRLVSTVFLGHDREDRVYGKDAWQRGSSIKARLQENLAAGTFTKNELVAARAILSRDMPVVVVSSGERSKKDREWARGQREISEAFQRLVKWNVVDGAPHEVWRVAKGMDAMDAGLGKLVAMGASLKEEE